MERIEIEELRQSLDDVINLVDGGKLRVMLEEHGEPRCAFVSLSDLELLEHVAGDPKRLPSHRAAHELLGSVNRGGLPALLDSGRCIVQRDGQDSAALVPLSDIETLQMIDDRIDLEVARRMLESGAAGGDID